MKGVYVGSGERRRRFIVVYNPEEEKRDRYNRERILKRLEEELKRLGNKRGRRQGKAVCALLKHERIKAHGVYAFLHFYL